ncbi:MAG: iron ABC transporter substrate-binding protein, partial [Pseudodesulfovibrio sp.]
MELVHRFRFLAAVLVLALFIPLPAQARSVTDAGGKVVEIPDAVERVICSGSGSLRLLTYLQGQ